MPLTLDDIAYVFSRGESLEQRALDGVSISVEPGEIVLVAGATGSGKSTLLQVAAGLLEATEGVATIDSEPLTVASARGRVGIAFQRPESQLFADSVIADVEFGPRNLGASAQEAADRSAAALRAVGLDPDDIGPRSPFALSGGQARRVAIAGVLAMDPDYLLLDEPLAGLDARGRADIMRVLTSARQERGVIVVSHDLDDVMPMADRVLILREGVPVFWGACDGLLAAPESLVEAGLRMPSVLDVQVRVHASCGAPAEFTLDPDGAAERLVAVVGRGETP